MVPYSYYGKRVSAVTLDTYDLNFGVPPSRETSADGNSLRAIFLVYFTKDKNAWLGLFFFIFLFKKTKTKKAWFDFLFERGVTLMEHHLVITPCPISGPHFVDIAFSLGTSSE